MVIFQALAISGVVLFSVGAALLVAFKAPSLLARPWKKMYRLKEEPVGLVRVLAILWAIAAAALGIYFVADLLSR